MTAGGRSINNFSPRTTNRLRLPVISVSAEDQTLFHRQIAVIFNFNNSLKDAERMTMGRAFKYSTLGYHRGP